MSWRDRDYTREQGIYGDEWAPVSRIRGWGRSVVPTLIVVNVAAFVLCSLTSRVSVLESPVFQWGAMHQPSVMHHGQVWRVLTAQYLHWDMMHLLGNMLGLYFFGRALEQEYGPRRFLGMYTAAGTLGMLFYLLLSAVGWLPNAEVGIAAGASGGVLALLGACAVIYPHAQVYVYALFPVRVRTLAWIFGAWYVFNVFKVGPNAGGDACHVAGLFFGLWWARWGARWWSSTEWRLPRRSRRPRVRVRMGPSPSAIADDEAVDRILKKVYESGLFSLSEAEKTTLREATERQRAREARFGRVDQL